MSILVSLAMATICFTSNGVNECHPVLLGKSVPTPVGEFNLTHLRTKSPGYGGDILQFDESKTVVYALHRVWLLRPDEHRLERLKSSNIEDHFISAGCINVEPEVYEKILDCCSKEKLIISK